MYYYFIMQYNDVDLLLKLQETYKKNSNNIKCGNCKVRPAVKKCKECHKLLCLLCDNIIHLNISPAFHTRISLDNESIFNILKGKNLLWQDHQCFLFQNLLKEIE